MDTRISRSPEETFQMGRELAETLQAGDVVGLIGDLGAGKTQMIKGIGSGLGISEKVHSPTFAIVNEYTTGRLPCFHLDLYRLESAAQLLSAGIDQYLLREDGVVLVEWFDRWTPDLPQPTRGKLIRIQAPTESEREISYEPFGA